MSDIWNKLDSGLCSIYLNYLQVREGGPASVPRVHPLVAAGGRLHVSMQYVGDLGEIEALGFHPVWRYPGGRATGAVDLADLERLAAHPGVLKMSFGREPEPTLDVSVPQIGANQVWSFASGSFSGSTGAGVIVGIIDTGIDFRHDFFLKTTTPKTTRIFRIWDPGLEPQAGEHHPNAAYLSGGVGGPTYGVEYTDVMINNVLQSVSGATPVRHRDCCGHGTHVASIAAGDGRPGYRYIGVAPGADLIVVKYLYLQKYPEVGGVAVDYEQLFRDAVSYILNVADQVYHAPVAINYSIGSNIGPHDGFTEGEDFLTHTFTGATGKIFVSAAGNSAGNRQHARLDFPAGGGTQEITLELYDPRTNRREFNRCKWENATRDLSVHLYYPTGGPAITAALDIPGDGAGFIAGPALGGAPVSGGFGGRQYTLSHATDNTTLSFTGHGTVNRNRFEIEIQPYMNRHRLGRYVVRVTSPDALTVHVWCQQARGHGFKVHTASAVAPEERFLIGSDGGAENIITVAAYDAEVATLGITNFSSRGPLASYGGGPGGPVKPDLAAPGHHVDAAKSRDARPLQPGQTVAKSGTSMSAPHVTGAVALMLQRNHSLTVAQVLSTLRSQATNVPPTSAEEAGAGRLNAKGAFDNTP